MSLDLEADERLERLRVQRDAALNECAVHAAFHTLAVTERNAERVSNASLRFELEELRAKLARTQAERDEACVELVRERGDAVEWLRDHGSEAWIEHGGLSLVNLDGIADAIERGEHRREVKP